MARLNEREIAINLLTSATMKEAAEKSNVSVSTVYRLKKKPEFLELLRQTKNEIYSETMQKAQCYSADALEVLREVSNDPGCSPRSGARVAAANSILSFAKDAFETENLIQRMDELEKRIRNDGN